MSRYAPSLPWQRHRIPLKTVCPPLLALLECSAARKWSRKLKRGQFVFDASFICARAPSNRFLQTRCKTRQNWFLRSRKLASFFWCWNLSQFLNLEIRFLLRCYDHLRFSTFSLFFNIRYLRISRSSIFVFSISLSLCLSLLIYVCLFPFFNLTSCRQRCFNCFHISSFSTTILPCLSLSLTSQLQAKLLQFSRVDC